MTAHTGYRSPLRWVIVLLWTGVAIWLMWTPNIPTPPSFLGDLTDKAAHFCLFAIHTALLAWALAGTAPMSRAARTAMLSIMAFSLVTELGQAFVPGRNVALLDLAANWLGAGMAMLILTRLFRPPARSA